MGGSIETSRFFLFWRTDFSSNEVLGNDTFLRVEFLRSVTLAILRCKPRNYKDVIYFLPSLVPLSSCYDSIFGMAVNNLSVIWSWYKSSSTASIRSDLFLLINWLLSFFESVINCKAKSDAASEIPYYYRFITFLFTISSRLCFLLKNESCMSYSSGSW